jgi:hypothetical protein
VLREGRRQIKPDPHKRLAQDHGTICLVSQLVSCISSWVTEQIDPESARDKLGSLKTHSMKRRMDQSSKDHYYTKSRAITYCSNGQTIHYYYLVAIVGRFDPLLLCHSSNGSGDISRAHYYNSFLIKKYNSLDLMIKHCRPHDCSMWGPHMYTRHLHHQLWAPQSTSTISSDHHTPEHRRQHTHTASLITIVTAIWTHVLPPQHASIITTRASACLKQLSALQFFK